MGAIEVYDKPRLGFWVGIVGAAMFGAVVGLVFGYGWSPFALLPLGIVPALVFRGGWVMALPSHPLLVIDSHGLEDPARRTRLAWEEIELAWVEETYVKGSACRSLIATSPRGRIDVGVDYAELPHGAIADAVERLWGQPVPTVSGRIADSGKEPPRADFAAVPELGRTGTGTGEPPLVIRLSRWHWVGWTFLCLLMAACVLGAAVAYVLEGRPLAPLLFVPFAGWLVWSGWKMLKLALRREPALVIDSVELRDPRDPIGVRWDEIDEITYAEVRTGSSRQHNVYVRLRDYERWAGEWRARWRPGLVEKPMEHPIRLPLASGLDVPAEEVVARIEREWGRPLGKESERGLDVTRRSPRELLRASLNERLVRAGLALEDRHDALPARGADRDQAAAGPLLRE